MRPLSFVVVSLLAVSGAHSGCDGGEVVGVPAGGASDGGGGDAGDGAGDAGDVAEDAGDVAVDAVEPELPPGEPDAADGEIDLGDAPDGGDGADSGGDAGDALPGDGDGDTGPDLPECQVDSDCEGDGPCRPGVCEAGACGTAEATDGTDCDDGNACSLGEICDDGACTAVIALACGDANPCTDDTCDPETGCVAKANLAPCDDEDPCTVGDGCKGGECVGTKSACDDGNSCTKDVCDPSIGACGHTDDDGALCDDGSECTKGDQCQGGACVAGAANGCADANPCTLEVCQKGLFCDYQVQTGPACQDGDPCTTGDACLGGVCLPGGPNACDDASACTTDACDPVAGCVHTPLVGTPCDDGSACTTASACDDAGKCAGTAVVSCEDGNECTTADCDPKKGCTYGGVLGPCDDEDACTEGDQCVLSSCKGTPVSCGDGDACTLDTCDVVLGCEHLDQSAACEDSEPCTDEGCDPDTGCVAPFNEAPCDDGLLCTEDDHCAEGTCTGAAVVCDDLDPCTIDACDPEEGCVAGSYFGPCDDGDACTLGEVCGAEGTCGGGAPLDVDDGVDCSIDTCDPVSGAAHEPSDELCGPGEACDVEEGCVTGDVRLLVVKLMLMPGAEPPPDGEGQWFAVANVGEIPFDLTRFTVFDATGHEGSIVAASGDEAEPVLLLPGEIAAGYRDVGEPAPDGFSFAYAPGLPFGFDADGDQLSIRSPEDQVLEVISFPEVTLGPEVGPNEFPLVPGSPIELDVATVASATSPLANDFAGLWCAWPEASAAPEGPSLECSRVRLNELLVASSGDGARWIELHLPAGGVLDGLVVRFLDAAGGVLGEHGLPSGRAPIEGLPVAFDGEEGLSIPVLSSGSVQLVRAGTVEDVYGFGTLTGPFDPGEPRFEGTAGPKQIAGRSSARKVDGVDTDDNAADWTSVVGGTPGEQNAP